MHSKNRLIFLLVVLIFLIRIVTSITPGHPFDQQLFFLWSEKLVSVGSANFYHSDIPTNNPVGYLYFLWLIGLVVKFLSIIWMVDNQVLNILHKLPANLADIAVGLIIYSIVKKQFSEKLASFSFLAYSLNPALVFNSAVWGQYDGLATLFLVLAVTTISSGKFYEFSAASFAIALSLKPQTIALAPILGLSTILFSKPLRWLTSAIAFLSVTILLYLPFSPSDPIRGLIYVNSQSLGSYACPTCFAFNFWGILGNGFGKSDLITFLKIPYLYWGIILVLTSWLFIFTFHLKQKFKTPYLYITTAVSLMAFYILLTRMHERYLYPVFPFLLLSALTLRSRLLTYIYIILSLLFFINLYITYSSANPSLALTPKLVNIIITYFNFFSALALACFIGVFVYFLRIKYKK